MNYPAVPVLMYHSVGEVKPDWIWNFLTVPLEVFVSQMEFLHMKGMQTLNLNELYDYVANGKRIANNSLVLTFDDGYLDNWVFAFPILKKYGFKATIFVNPEFVDPNPIARPNLENVLNGDVKISALERFGFLSWEEMRRMQSTGLIDIQSHAMSHTWYPAEDKIIDFRHPMDDYVWMDWNAHPQRKYQYLSHGWNPISKYGMPVYLHRKSLEGRRLYPPKELTDVLVDYVQHGGGTRFFENGNWRDQLLKKLEEIEKQYSFRAIIESEREFKDRLNYEIFGSKQVIEKKLSKEVNFLCWPGGGNCREAVELASEHYKAVTLPSSSKIEKKNRFGENPFYIKRIGAPNMAINGTTHYFHGRYLYHFLMEFRNSRRHRIFRQFLKLAKLIRWKAKAFV